MVDEETPVSDYMTDLVHSIPATTRVEQVYERLEELDVSALAVIDSDRRPVGVVSRTDLVRAARRPHRGAPRLKALEFVDEAVSEIMRPGVITVEVDRPLAEVALLMVEERIHRVFVTERGSLVGVTSTLDLMQAAVDLRVATPIGEIMSEDLVVIRGSATTQDAVDRLMAHEVHALVVVEGPWPIGTFGQADALIARELPADTPVEACMDPAVLSLPMGMAVHRAVAHALAMDVEEILVMDDDGLRGVVTGIDIVSSLLPRSGG